jgi:hypothetical protein
VALFRIEARILTRSTGSNMLAAAAYRSGTRLHDQMNATTHDYTAKAGRVVATEIIGPAHMPEALRDRTQLWKTVEATEKRCDAQLAREFLLSLPHELSDGERIALVRSFVQEQYVAKGMVADIAWHRPDTACGEHPHNHHAHVLTTLRRCTPHGLAPVKTRAWNAQSQLHAWRAAYAAHCNQALARAGHQNRVDHRTLTAQKVDALQNGDLRSAFRLNRFPEPYIPRAALRAGRTTASPPYIAKSYQAKLDIIARNAAQTREAGENLRELFIRLDARPAAADPDPQSALKDLLFPLFEENTQPKIPREWLLKKVLAEQPLLALVTWLMSDAQLLEELRRQRIAALEKRYGRAEQVERGQTQTRARQRVRRRQ